MTPPEEFEDLTLGELLDLLEPLPELAPISYFPQTAIWAWLALGLTGLLATVALLVYRRWRANAYRRAALAELRRIRDVPSEQAKLLRRVALAAFPRRDVASLIGDEWLAFLDETHGQNAFRSPLGRSLIAAAYDGTAAQGQETSRLVERWVRDHRVPAPRADT